MDFLTGICIASGGAIAYIVIARLVKRACRTSKHTHTAERILEPVLVQVEVHYHSTNGVSQAQAEADHAQEDEATKQLHRYEFCKYLIRERILTDELPLPIHTTKVTDD